MIWIQIKNYVITRNIIFKFAEIKNLFYGALSINFKYIYIYKERKLAKLHIVCIVETKF